MSLSALEDGPICDFTGVCMPISDTDTRSNCEYCGKELVKVDGEWKPWDYDIN